MWLHIYIYRERDITCTYTFSMHMNNTVTYWSFHQKKHYERPKSHTTGAKDFHNHGQGFWASSFWVGCTCFVWDLDSISGCQFWFITQTRTMVLEHYLQNRVRIGGSMKANIPASCSSWVSILVGNSDSISIQLAVVET